MRKIEERERESVYMYICSVYLCVYLSFVFECLFMYTSLQPLKHWFYSPQPGVFSQIWPMVVFSTTYSYPSSWKDDPIWLDIFSNGFEPWLKPLTEKYDGPIRKIPNFFQASFVQKATMIVFFFLCHCSQLVKYEYCCWWRDIWWSPPVLGGSKNMFCCF